MSRKQTGNSSPVTLFPFLAVLICAMGALIFLLLVTTRNIREEVLARVTSGVPADSTLLSIPSPATLPIEESPIPLESAPLAPVTKQIAIPEPVPAGPDPAWLAAEEKAARQERLNRQQQIEWSTRLREARAAFEHQLQAVQKQETSANLASEVLQQLEEAARSVAGQLAQLKSQQSSLESQNKLPAERELLEKQLAALKDQLANPEKNKTGQSKYMVVPFDTQTGTTRRPILIECTDRGLRFLPEDITLSAEDLDGFTERFNPLLAGSRALVNYWTRRNQLQPRPGEEPQPYILLLVRPSGTVGYYVAMKMLTPLGRAFGYELIEENTELQLPELDPAAKEALEDALRQVLRERQQLQAAIRSGPAEAEITHKTGGGGTSRGFNVADLGVDEQGELLPSAGGNGRSWENIDRFQGQQNRGGKPSKGGSASATSDKARPREQLPQPPGGFAPPSSDASGKTDSSQDSALAGEDFGSDRFSPNGIKPAVKRPANQQPEGRLASTDLLNIPPAPAGESSPPIDESMSPGPQPNETRSAAVANKLSRTTAGQKSAPGGDGDSQSPPPADIALDRSLAERAKRQLSSMSRGQRRDIPVEMLGRRRWGQCDDDAQIGREKQVKIEVEADRLVIDRQMAIALGQGETRNELLLQVLMAIDDQANTWGYPGRNLFWVPKAHFVIYPGGNQHFERLQPSLVKAGLPTSKEFKLDAGPRIEGTAP